MTSEIELLNGNTNIPMEEIAEMRRHLATALRALDVLCKDHVRLLSAYSELKLAILEGRAKGGDKQC